MKKIYIYADETEQELNGELYLGYGLLFCESRIPDSFISDSISNLLLKHSIEVTKFHACDDNNIIKKVSSKILTKIFLVNFHLFILKSHLIQN